MLRPAVGGVKLGHAFGAVVGKSPWDCHLIGYRHVRDRHAESAESWVVQVRGSNVTPLMGGLIHARALWRTPGGHVYVGETEGRVHVNRDLTPGGTPWEVYELPFLVRGVWGLDDDHVFAWGVRDARGAMARFRGYRWDLVEPPPGFAMCLHGTGPDALVAAGHDGVVARWDGEAWRELASPTDARFRRIFAAPTGELWACTADRRLLLHDGELREVASWDGELRDVAVWRGEVWVAADDGLLRWSAERGLERISDRPARHLHAGQELLVGGRGAVRATKDGDTWTWIDVDRFVAAMHAIPFHLPRGL